MTKEQDKQIKVPSEIHQEIKFLSVKEGREMREIVTTAFEFYIKHRNNEFSPPLSWGDNKQGKS